MKSIRFSYHERSDKRVFRTEILLYDGIPETLQLFSESSSHVALHLVIEDAASEVRYQAFRLL